MKRAVQDSREELLCRLLEKAESRGGEEWLKRCLSEESGSVLSVSPAAVPEMSVGAPRKQPGRKKKCKTNNLAPQAEGAATRGASCQQGSSAASSPPPGDLGEHVLPEVVFSNVNQLSAFSSLIESLSVIVQQFKGIHDADFTSQNVNMYVQPGESLSTQACTVSQSAQETGAGNSDNAIDMEEVGVVWHEAGHPSLLNKDVTVRSSVRCPAVNNTLPLRSSAAMVSESSFKEPLPCSLSPLGFHLSKSVKEKIWRGEYLDILSLLPASKEFLAKSDRQSSERTEEDRRRAVPKTFQNWLQAFCIYSAVMGERFPGKCSGLFQHLDIIAEAFRHFGGSAWFSYDENFRQKLAVHPSLHWGAKDVGLWLNLMLPPRPQFTPRPASNGQSPVRKGVCFAFNEGQCKFLLNCRYKHECSYCGGTHAASRCFRKAAASSSHSGPKDTHGKGPDSGEPGKNAPMARALSRPQDGGSAN